MGQQEQSPLGHKKQNDKGENHRDDHLQRRITSILGSARRTQPLHSAHFGGAMMALSGPKKTAIAHKWVPGVSNCPKDRRPLHKRFSCHSYVPRFVDYRTAYVSVRPSSV
jgi:hypothetical protein